MNSRWAWIQKRSCVAEARRAKRGRRRADREQRPGYFGVALALRVGLRLTRSPTTSQVQPTTTRCRPLDRAGCDRQPASVATSPAAVPSTQIPAASVPISSKMSPRHPASTFTYRNGEDADPPTCPSSNRSAAASRLIDYDGDGLLDVFLPGGGYFAGAGKKEIRGHPGQLYRNLGGCKFEDVTRPSGLDSSPAASRGSTRTAPRSPTTTATAGPTCSSPAGAASPCSATSPRRTRAAGGSRTSTREGRAGQGHHLGDQRRLRRPRRRRLPRPVRLPVRRLVVRPTTRECTYDGKTPDVCPPKKFDGLPHKLYRNNGNGTFVRRQRRRPGSGGGRGKGLGVLIVDVDGDGKPDVYVANDTVDNFLYLNRVEPGQIRFTKSGLLAGVGPRRRGGTPTAAWASTPATPTAAAGRPCG